MNVNTVCANIIKEGKKINAEKIDKQFNSQLSNKSAKESADVFIAHNVGLADEIDKQFNSQLSNKSAKESADVFMAVGDNAGTSGTKKFLKYWNNTTENASGFLKNHKVLVPVTLIAAGVAAALGYKYYSDAKEQQQFNEVA